MMTLEFRDGSTTTYSLVRVEPEEVAFDVQSYRGAGASRWLGFGSGDPERVALSVRLEVQPPNPEVTFGGVGVTYGGQPVEFLVLVTDRLEDTIENLKAAVLVTTNFGSWRVAGVESVVEQPSELGYVARVALNVLNPRFESSSDVLRLQSGRVWELR
ncbi:MAG: hypothetical protein RI554_07985 [Trueperaceae bacterium]|nr:hypothetical protein [Trueperaceae bacterium]